MIGVGFRSPAEIKAEQPQAPGLSAPSPGGFGSFGGGNALIGAILQKPQQQDQQQQNGFGQPAATQSPGQAQRPLNPLQAALAAL